MHETARGLTSGTALAAFKNMKSVLIADDDISVPALIARAPPEYRITTGRNGFEALALASVMSKSQSACWPMEPRAYSLPTRRAS